MVAKKWQPEDRCPAGRPKTTWRRHSGKGDEGRVEQLECSLRPGSRKNWLEDKNCSLMRLMVVVKYCSGFFYFFVFFWATVSSCFFVWPQLQGSWLVVYSITIVVCWSLSRWMNKISDLKSQRSCYRARLASKTTGGKLLLFILLKGDFIYLKHVQFFFLSDNSEELHISVWRVTI